MVGVMVMAVMAVVAICMLADTVMADTVMAGTVTCIMVGQAMPITDLLIATVMVIPATVMHIMGMAGGTTVTGTPVTVAGGVATGTLMVLERAGVSGQQ
jgi:hypothetical protein